MIVFPNAKINIGLNIISKRADGYHNLETVFYPIMIKDALEIVESDKLTFTSSGLTIPGEPEKNLCLKAYQLLLQDFKLPPLNIHLHKNIPIGAGLGGGSADASFLLRLLNDKFELGINQAQLEAYASELGSDCPFFINNEPVFASGRGDEFEKITLDLSRYFKVLVMPEISVSTSEAFKAVNPVLPQAPLKELITTDIELWKGSIENDFEKGIITLYPEIGKIKDSLYGSGAIYASMSGSGSSVYGIFREPLKLSQLEATHRVFYGI